MTIVERHQSGLFLKSKSNSAIVLFAQISPIRLFTISVSKYFVLSLSFFASFRVCLGHSKKLGSQKIAAASGMVSTIWTILVLNSSYCHVLLAFTTGRHWQPAKLRSMSSTNRLAANSQRLISNATLMDRFLLI